MQTEIVFSGDYCFYECYIFHINQFQGCNMFLFTTGFVPMYLSFPKMWAIFLVDSRRASTIDPVTRKLVVVFVGVTTF
jgi:hypothetical protein